MAGNVKEWCWNKAGGDKRFCLGGAWREPRYMFGYSDALAAFDRSDFLGFRCIRELWTKAPEQARAEIPLSAPRDYHKERPVSDDSFRIYLSMYRYDNTPLNSQIVAHQVTAQWIHETIQFDAAYGNERVTAHLYLPRHVVPPYQTVVHFPGIGVRDEPVFPAGEWDICGIPQILAGGGRCCGRSTKAPTSAASPSGGCASVRRIRARKASARSGWIQFRAASPDSGRDAQRQR
jgi:hypothetical protein